MILAEQLHARILEELDLTREIEDEELTQLIYRVLNEAGVSSVGTEDGAWEGII